MDVKILATSYGSFSVHKRGCPIIPRDINVYKVSHDYNGEDVNSVLEIAQALQEAEAPHQSLAIIIQRIICHHCAWQLEGSGIKGY